MDKNVGIWYSTKVQHIGYIRSKGVRKPGVSARTDALLINLNIPKHVWSFLNGAPWHAKQHEWPNIRKASFAAAFRGAGPPPCARRTETYVQNYLPSEKSKHSCETCNLSGRSERIHVVFDVSIAHRSKRSDSEFSEFLRILPSQDSQWTQDGASYY